ncbi:MAG TPA: enoyl-CoA hydratase/isomerase family protein [Acidimicrobiales bacterium]|nr:enoyl-CoA hydratase/isomerase family protein [Acidimicrobiales bacterium]
MSDSLTLLDRPSPAVAVVTLNRPERRNALSIALRDAISDRLDLLETDPELKVVVITGAGPVFSAGFDLGEFQTAAGDPRFSERLWASSDRYHQALATFPLVTVAALNGPAIAGGFDLAVLCDLRVAATTTRFSHPEHTFGDVVYGPLADIVGGGLARELCLTGRELTAPEALAAHLVTDVVEPADVLARALVVADTVALGPRAALQRTKAKILTRRGVSRETATLDM